MRKFIFFNIIFCILILNSAYAKNIQAYLSYSIFNTAKEGSYIETYLAVSASSVRYIKKPSGKFQGSVEILFIFKKDTNIKTFKKYNLLSPEIDDTNATLFNLIDLQRILLPEGTYNFEIQLTDNNNKNSKIKTTEVVNVNFPTDKVCMSSIELIENYKATIQANTYSKNGYDLTPFIFEYFPQKKDKLAFYAEVYNTDKILGGNQQYLLNCYIQVYETKQKLSDFNVIKKQTTAPVNVILNEFPIQNLPSGNYNLVIEIRSRNNDSVASGKIFFQRNNPAIQINFGDITALNIGKSFVEKYKSSDTLYDYVKSTRPISTTTEKEFCDINFGKNAHDLKVMQQYFLRFWERRNEQNPEKAWLEYYEEVKKVNTNFSTRIKRGYETDRGRVYLQYGPPNTIVKEDKEPQAYPYEIWHYYKIKDQANKKFVFYNPDLVSNDYELLHSDAIGEMNNYKWNIILNKRNNPWGNIDDTTTPTDNWGGKSMDFFKNPY